MKTIIIGSKNPVKISAVKDGFEQIFPHETFECIGYSVESGVSDQPMSDDETIRGAMGRAERCKDAYPDADFRVGLEGGIREIQGELMVNSRVSVLTSDWSSLGSAGNYFLPRAVSDLLRSGMELGEADDVIFGTANSKQQGGSVGLMTNGVVVRSEYFVRAVVFALVKGLNIEVWE